MDPVAHTFVGGALSAAGLRRATPLATATLLLGANAPDIDIAFQLLGPNTALAMRRGITHGVPALLLLPLLVAGVVLLWDRRIRRRTRPELEPARTAPVVALAFLGVWTHPFLDWLNTYGMRWWLPFHGEWSYGDALFIVDPWLWLLLGGALFLGWSRSTRARWRWGILATVMTALVLGISSVPALAKALWVAGLILWISLRVRDRNREHFPEFPARAALAITGVYMLAMVLQTRAAEQEVLREARSLSPVPIEAVMVGPVPANPFLGQVILKTPDAYRLGRFSWLGSPRVTFEARELPRPPATPAVAAAREHPDAQAYLTWSRFPLVDVRPVGTEEEGWDVTFRDVRYLGRGTGLDGPTVRVVSDGEGGFRFEGSDPVRRTGSTSR